MPDASTKMEAHSNQRPGKRARQSENIISTASLGPHPWNCQHETQVLDKLSNIFKDIYKVETIVNGLEIQQMEKKFPSSYAKTSMLVVDKEDQATFDETVNAALQKAREDICASLITSRKAQLSRLVENCKAIINLFHEDSREHLAILKSEEAVPIETKYDETQFEKCVISRRMQVRYECHMTKAKKTAAEKKKSLHVASASVERALTDEKIKNLEEKILLLTKRLDEKTSNARNRARTKVKVIPGHAAPTAARKNTRQDNQKNSSAKPQKRTAGGGGKNGRAKESRNL